MTDQHPITPPFELMNQWYKKACKDPYNGGKFIMAPVLKDISNSAAQWGADQELDACCVLMDEWGLDGEDLMQCRRPKPPIKADQALAALNTAPKAGTPTVILDIDQFDTILLALKHMKEMEGLPND